MPDKDNKEFVYVLIGVGITLLAIVTILSFLTYRKVEHQSWQNIGTAKEVSPIQKLDNVSQNQYPQYPQSPIYDERIYRMLEDNQNKLHDRIEDVNSNINSLKLQYRIPSLGMNIVGKPARAGSVISVKTPVEDKTRQKEFGMI